MISLNYEELLERFGLSLRENLRLTGISDPMFELWVPDDDPVRSLQSLLHSIDQTGPGQDVTIDVSAARLGQEQVDALMAQFGEGLSVTAPAPGDIWRITRTDSPAQNSVNGVDDGTKTGIRDYSTEADRLSPATLHPARPAAPVLPAPLAAFLTERAATGAKHGSPSDSHTHGPADAPDNVFTANEGPLRLVVKTCLPDATSTDGHIVTGAHHSGGTGTPVGGLLDMLCEIAPGLPVSEIADHGTIRLAEACCGAVPGAKPDSIAAALTFTPEFRAITALLRQLPGMREQGELGAGYSPKPDDAWLDAGADFRLSRVSDAIAGFCDTHGMPADAVLPIGILDDLSGWPVRVVVACSDAVPASDRSSLIRSLERILKEQIEPALTVLYEARRDGNKIRRL